MNIAIIRLIQNDFQLQWRYRITVAYAVVVSLYTAAIVYAGDAFPNWLVALIIYSDPAVLGFFFLGGLMMLEKAESVRTALALSPMTTTQYLGAKTISLTVLAVIAVLILALAAHLPVKNLAPALFVIVCVSVMFTSVGAIAALRFKTVSGYMIGSAPIVTPLILPAALLLFEPLPLLAFAVPPIAQVKLLTSLFEQSAVPNQVLIVCYASCILSAVFCFALAAHTLKKELGVK